MKTYQIRRIENDPRNGSALLTVMIVVVISMMATASLFAYSLNTTHRIRVMTEAIRAKAIAEAGANRAYNAMVLDKTLRGSRTLYSGTSFGDGTYTVTLEEMPNGWTRMVSDGHFGRADHSIGCDVRIDDGSAAAGTNAAPSFADFGIFCNGALVINGTPKNINGDLHSNGSFALHGVYANVNGHISAPPPNDVPAGLAAPWQNVHFPQLWEPEFQAWLAEQQAAGIPVTRYNGSQTFKKDHTFNGITIIDGAVTFIGSGTRTINGLFYVSGSFTANGSTTLSGSIMAGGSMTINGASAILAYDGTIVGGGEDPIAEGPEPIEIWWD